MIKDIFDSFKDNVKHKTTNPFFGTFIAIWIFKNWIIIYAVFNFDDQSTLNDRIEFIKNHLSKETFLWDLWYSVLWTFLVLIISYSLLNLSRLIINFFEKRISPIVYKITDSKDIVLKSDFDNLVNENDRLKGRFEKERENRLKAELERDEFEKRLLEKATGNQTTKADEPEKQKPKLEDNDLKNIADNLEQNKYLEKFESIIVSIDNKSSLNQNDPFTTHLVKIGLIDKGTYHSGNFYFYKFTNDGQRFKKYYVNNYLLKKH